MPQPRRKKMTTKTISVLDAEQANDVQSGDIKIWANVQIIISTEDAVEVVRNILNEDPEYYSLELEKLQKGTVLCYNSDDSDGGLYLAWNRKLQDTIMDNLLDKLGEPELDFDDINYLGLKNNNNGLWRVYTEGVEEDNSLESEE